MPRGQFLAGVGVVCLRHWGGIEEVEAVKSGGGGGGKGAGAVFFVKVFKVFSLDRVQPAGCVPAVQGILLLRVVHR